MSESAAQEVSPALRRFLEHARTLGESYFVKSRGREFTPGLLFESDKGMLSSLLLDNSSPDALRDSMAKALEPIIDNHATSRYALIRSVDVTMNDGAKRKGFAIEAGERGDAFGFLWICATDSMADGTLLFENPKLVEQRPNIFK